MAAKKREQVKVYHGDHVPVAEARQYARETFQFENYMILKEFRGRHPAVMEDRIRSARRWAVRRNRWLNWRFYREILRRGFRG
jgi:hypothetical protein